MKTNVVQYKWAGSWGPFRVKTRCGECNLTEGIIRHVLDNEFRGVPIEFTVRPWLDYWWRLIWKGAWHAPIVLVDGKLVQQGRVIDRGLLAYHLRRSVVARYEPRGNVVFYKDGCPYCERAKNILDREGIVYEKRNVVTDPLASLQLFHAARKVLPRGQSVTVPQIWLGGKYFGDSEAVVRAHGNGGLKPFVSAARPD